MIDVGSTNDFDNRTVTVVSIGQREIGIVRWDDDFHAVSNVCPHQGGPLCEGRLSAQLIGSSPGLMETDEATPVLTCPWHGWEFDLCSGRVHGSDRDRVRTYPVEVAGGRVLVELKLHRERRSASSQ